MEILVFLLVLFSPWALAQGEPAPEPSVSPPPVSFPVQLPVQLPVKLNDVLLLSHPLGPMVKLKFQVEREGNAQEMGAGGFRPPPAVEIARDEIHVVLSPCHAEQALKKRFKSAPLQLTLENNWVLKGFLENEKDRCDFSLITPVAFFNFFEINQMEEGVLTLQGFFYCNG